MTRVRLSVLGLAALLALSPVAAAMAQGNGQNNSNDQNGSGPGNHGQGSAYGHDKQDDGGGPAVDNGGGDPAGDNPSGGDAGGAGESQGAIGQDPGASAPPPPEPPVTTQSAPPDVAAPEPESQAVEIETDSELALAAVRSQRALPLEQILETANEDHDGRLIDARLITVGNFLLYELKLLEPNGDVETLYYYARSGIQVRED